MKKKTIIRSVVLIVAIVLVLFPALLWRDEVFVLPTSTKITKYLLSLATAPARVPRPAKATMLSPTSVSATATDASASLAATSVSPNLALAPELPLASLGGLVSSTSPAISTSTTAAKVTPAITPISTPAPITTSTTNLAVSPGFGGGFAPTPARAPDVAAGRDIDDETCPLIH